MVLPLLFPHWTHPCGGPLPFRCCFLTLKQMKKKLTREKITFFSVFLGSCENFKWLHSAPPAKLTWTANAGLPSPAWVPTATARFGESPVPASFHPPSVLLSSLPSFFPFLSFLLPPFFSFFLSHSLTPLPLTFIKNP